MDKLINHQTNTGHRYIVQLETLRHSIVRSENDRIIRSRERTISLLILKDLLSLWRHISLNQNSLTFIGCSFLQKL